MILLKILISIIFFNYHVNAEHTEIVKTDKGLVQGKIVKTAEQGLKYSSFKGIPYAKPPININRFRYAGEAAPWQGVLNATKDPSPCAQWHPADNYYFGSEDCLYLNVYTPEVNFTNPGSRAVVVWIHGGAFLVGSINSSLQSPDSFIEKDVIVVAMNYRLGALGFLTLKNIVGGNSGLKDQLQALQWVRKNIVKFGGDPEKVTIIGENAGAVSVELHKLSDKSKGLFRGSIAIGGSPLNYWGFHGPSKAAKRFHEFINKFEMTETTVKGIYLHLRRLSTEEIVRATHEMILETMDIPFKPTVEMKLWRQNSFLMQCPLVKYQTGNFSKTPHIIGYIEKEPFTFEKLMESLPYMSGRNVDEEIMQRSSDVSQVEAIARTRRYLTAFKPAPVFFYQDSFDYDHIKKRQKQDEEVVDQNLIWNFNREDLKDPNSPISKHRDDMVTMWVNFAKYLRPSFNEKEDLGVVWSETVEELRSFRPNTLSIMEYSPLLDRFLGKLSAKDSSCY